jgi:hypothetical protein
MRPRMPEDWINNGGRSGMKLIFRQELRILVSTRDEILVRSGKRRFDDMVAEGCTQVSEAPKRTGTPPNCGLAYWPIMETIFFVPGSTINTCSCTRVYR